MSLRDLFARPRLRALFARRRLRAFSTHLTDHQQGQMDTLLEKAAPELLKKMDIATTTVAELAKLPPAERDQLSIALGVSLITGTIACEMDSNRGVLINSSSFLTEMLSTTRCNPKTGEPVHGQHTAVLVTMALAICIAAGIVKAKEDKDMDPADLHPARFAQFLVQELSAKADEEWLAVVDSVRQLADAENVQALEELFNMDAAEKTDAPSS